ncbi:MAG TPA: DUF5916 domain-containing protein, partial [Candidatus Acidoferrales bacterium]
MQRLRQLAALAVLLASAPLAAQAQNASTPPRELKIQFIDAEVRIDGRLDEDVWHRITPFGDFLQMEPDEGQPASQKTEVFIFYDRDRLYLGFKCYETDPSRITGRMGAHDALTRSDSVDIFLDPFGDRRTGYWFSVNAVNIKFDALVSESAGMDSRWDGIWQSATHKEDWGWGVEIAIPFKSIRFREGVPWGFNLRRDIVRRNEVVHWQFVTRFDGRFRPSKSGTLTGIDNVEPGRNLEVVPYVSTRFRRGAPPGAENSNHYEGGVDIRWGLLPNATANIAINPDFADTEADEENIAVSRFELFFPEKRAFFNEGSNFFSTPLSLFFTRRVGQRLPDGLAQRILLGAKLTGKVGPWSLGMLEARTQETEFLDPSTGTTQIAPGANFFVLRGQRDIWSNSTIGFITVNRDQQDGAIGAAQRVHALDLNIVRGPHIKWSNQVAYSQNDITPEGGIHRTAFRSGFEFETSDWEIGAEYKYLGRGFDVSEIGFEPETDRHNAVANVEWKPFINRYGIRQIFFEVNQDIKLDTRGLTHDSGSDADLSARFQNFWFARIRYSYDLVRFNEFTPGFGRLDRTRTYLTPRLRLFLNTNEQRAWYVSYMFHWHKLAQFRENFYGRGQEHTLQVTLRPGPGTAVQFNGTWIRELLEDGT